MSPARARLWRTRRKAIRAACPRSRLRGIPRALRRPRCQRRLQQAAHRSEAVRRYRPRHGNRQAARLARADNRARAIPRPRQRDDQPAVPIPDRCALSRAWCDLRRFPSGRYSASAGAQRGHQRLPGVAQQRSSGANRVPQAGPPLPFAGAGIAETRRRFENHQDRQLRLARGAGTFAHPGLSHPRRLRFRGGAGDRQCGARVPDHRLRLSHQRARRVAAHQSPVRVRLPPRLGQRSFSDRSIGPAGSRKKIPAILSRPLFPIRRSAASTWDSPSSIRKPPRNCARESRTAG
jgi:hypothetical protein